MILIKKITPENCRQFSGLPENVLVCEHKRGPEKFRHTFFLVGIIVGEQIDGENFFTIKFTNGDSRGRYDTIYKLLLKQSAFFDFYYIEIKHNQ